MTAAFARVVTLCALAWCTLASLDAAPLAHASRELTAPPHPPVDSIAVRRAAERDIAVFFLRWRTAWKDSDTERFEQAAFALTSGVRSTYLHCHARTSRDPMSGRADSYAQRVRDQYAAILSARSLFAKCPTWIIGVRTSAVDEADSLDVALLPQYIPDIMSERTRLIASLDSLQQLMPADGWLTGQRVRFRIDQRELTAASRVAAACVANAAWCAALGGYAAWIRDDTHAADSLFALALSRMSEAQRCEWLDIAPLIPEPDRAAYSKLACGDRIALTERYFWLADPVLTDSVNERRIEHFARRVMITLHADVVQDERHLFDEKRGGDAVVASLLRYGWPSTAMWTGRDDESGHTSYLNGSSRGAPPYSTAEYAPGRAHYAPTWSAVLQPSQAHSTDWQLHSPLGMWAVFNDQENFWWPVEHMRDLHRLMTQLPDPGQLAFWPRQHEVRVAAILDIANDASADAKAFVGHAVRARLVSSSSPANTRVIARREQKFGASLRLDGALSGRDSLPGVLDIHVESVEDGIATARTRFGATPPLALDQLAVGTIALSDPVLFTEPRTRAMPGVVDSVIPRLRANTVITADRAVGVYWECYGVQRGDSVRVSVRVVSADKPSLLQRLASAVRLTTGGETSITVAWNEPSGGAGGADRAAAGLDSVSIAPRSIVLDLAAAKSGNYWLEISATTSRGAAATSRRRITVR